MGKNDDDFVACDNKYTEEIVVSRTTCTALGCRFKLSPSSVLLCSSLQA